MHVLSPYKKGPSILFSLDLLTDSAAVRMGKVGPGAGC